MQTTDSNPFEKIVAAPPWLAKIITDPVKRDSARMDDGATPRGGAHEDLSETLNGVPEKKRDTQISRYVFSRIGRGMSRAEITTLVLEAAAKCTPPFPQEEALEKIKNGFEQYQRKHPEYREPGIDITEADQKQKSTAVKRGKRLLKAIAVNPPLLGMRLYTQTLAMIKTEDPKLFIELEQVARKYNIKRQFDAAVKRGKLKVASGPAQLPRVTDMLTPLKIPAPPGADNLLVPQPFRFDAVGTAKMRETDAGVFRDDVAPGYICPVSRFKDVNTDVEHVQLAFFERNAWHTITVQRDAAVEARRLTTAAAQYGFPVGSSNAARVAEFMLAFLAENTHTMPLTQTVDHLGWIDSASSATFLLGNTTISAPGAPPVHFQPMDSGDRQIGESFHEAGTFEPWLETIESVKQYPRVMVGIYTSLAAPLLKILDCDNFGTHFHDRSSTGKTTDLMIAASVWGNPVVGSPRSCVHSWDLTAVAIERKSATGADLPLFLDDTKRGNPQQIGAALYRFHQGRGRGRGSKTGLAMDRAWRSTMISTGEARATSYTQDAGTRSRYLEIGGLPFKDDNDQTRELVNKIHNAIRHNYGHAGPRFIRWLIDNHARWNEFRSRYHEQTKRYETNDGVTSRLADAAAAIATAGILAHEACVLPGEFQDPFITLWPPILMECGTAHAHVRALHAIFDWCVAHQNNFYGQNPLDTSNIRELSSGWIGQWAQGDTWDHIGVIPAVLKRTLTNHGFDAEAVIAEWNQRDWTMLDRDKKPVKREINGKWIRVVALKREIIDREIIDPIILSTDSRPLREGEPTQRACTYCANSEECEHYSDDGKRTCHDFTKRGEQWT